ncbi:hypothetical protein D5041_03810 [Verminephrobacter aporrectodeae subsp. tuberculatae]|uniref:hypothetical protein n=1 Tax=Verminephrobacter aporrectodeae TaxID=1110389 RepID=UPI002237AA50|nr:hypothetical protein [Verminephrobacter aporrectodeae]MCW5222753.1 hypothetical protein [Verminephrobacter aporrectodeae subsp. tuberculatae]MCW5288217.1 hypothetical protein [Verminephrobacter aporrectodeae subsp. tuberculatae]
MPGEIKPTIDTAADPIDPAVVGTGQSTTAPAATAAFKVLIHDINWDCVDQVRIDTTAHTVTQSIAPAANPTGGIDQDAPLDARSPATKTAFKVLVYDSNWDFVDHVAVDAIAQTVVLNVGSATNSNDYWVQDSAGTWVNLGKVPRADVVGMASEQLWRDFQIAHGEPCGADDAITAPGPAGQVPLSLVGQAPDLAHGGLWL